MTIRVKRDNSLSVSAPARTPRSEIMAFLLRRSDWVEDAMEKNRISRSHARSRISTIPYLGRELSTEVESGRTSGYRIEDDSVTFVVRGKWPQNGFIPPRLLEQFYRSEAKKYLQGRLDFYAAKMGLKVKTMRVKDVQSIWGSASVHGNVNFNYRLIFTPPEIVDYIVVHELSHFIHRNHSAAFHKEVGGILPDWYGRRKWLKENATLLFHRSDEMGLGK